jgi:ATP phosphoribosyltransferase regulatory subunit
VTFDLPQTWAEQPVGMRDVYPEQAKYRRDIESKLLAFFEQHGYHMVSSGAFEYVDTLLRGRQVQEADDWLRWFDPNGRMVALRPDMTPSIARMAAPLVASGTKEIRWCYAEKVFRRSNDPASLSWVSGKAAESTQVGVEWIGPAADRVDVDLLALCQRSVEHLGLADWQMVVSHAKLTASLLEVLGLSQEARETLMQYLIRGDYVGFRQVHTDYGITEDVLGALSQVNPLDPGSLSAFLAHSREDNRTTQRVWKLWDELTEFASVLALQGLTEHLSFDFTLTRDLSYYTGIIFEVFVPGVGAPVALGGRYDDLLAQFGSPAPAVGFTFEVERLLTALTDGRWLAESMGKGDVR